MVKKNMQSSQVENQVEYIFAHSLRIVFSRTSFIHSTFVMRKNSTQYYNLNRVMEILLIVTKSWKYFSTVKKVVETNQ